MIIYGRIAARKRRLQRRLNKDHYPDDLSQPMIRGSAPQYELSGRATGTTCGGIGLIHQMVRELGLADAIGGCTCSRCICPITSRTTC